MYLVIHLFIYFIFIFFICQFVNFFLLGYRPSKWINKDYYREFEDSLPPSADNTIAMLCNYIIVDSIDHLTKELETLNESVKILQTATFHQRQKVDEQETRRQQNVHGKFEAHATIAAGKFLSTKVKSFETVTNKISEIFRSVGMSATSVSSESTVNDAESGM